MKYESAVESSANRSPASAENPPTTFDRSSLSTAKRISDLLIAIPALFFLSPVMLLVGLFIRLQDGGPVFFVQDRRGLGGASFACMKFRTMRTDAEDVLGNLLATDPEMAAEWRADQKLRKDPRITKIGHFLRKTSIDELPQLLNIIRGEMSIVGPRPIVEDEVRRYGDKIDTYDSIRPGVIGLWQINGRNNTTYEERVEMDVEYAENISVLGDMAILIRSIPAILFGRGAY
jgi:lipopolysaccharide/colanic/teichoic acid biosynthesis glycosyltransferase